MTKEELEHKNAVQVRTINDLSHTIRTLVIERATLNAQLQLINDTKGQNSVGAESKDGNEAK